MLTTACVMALSVAVQAAVTSTTVPIEIQRGSPVATIAIGDKELRVIVDSGGRLLGLRSEVIAGLDGLRATGRASSTDVYGSATEADAFVVPDLFLGGSRFRDVAGFVWAVPQGLRNSKPAIDGIIGREFLNEFRVVYDYPGARILLEERGSDEASACRGTPVPLVEHPEGVVVTEIDLDFGTVRALWDTGATYSFIKSEAAEAAGLELERMDARTQKYRSRSVKFGSKDLGQLDFVVLPLVQPEGIDVYIGYNFFANHVVCIDYQAGELRLQ